MNMLPPIGIGLDVVKKIDISTELKSGPEDLSDLGDILTFLIFPSLRLLILNLFTFKVHELGSSHLLKSSFSEMR
jgi:hypothetical protein